MQLIVQTHNQEYNSSFNHHYIQKHCNACDNAANIFTKPLGRIKFELFREMLGVLVNPSSIKGEC